MSSSSSDLLQELATGDLSKSFGLPSRLEHGARENHGPTSRQIPPRRRSSLGAIAGRTSDRQAIGALRNYREWVDRRRPRRSPHTGHGRFENMSRPAGNQSVSRSGDARMAMSAALTAMAETQAPCRLGGSRRTELNLTPDLRARGRPDFELTLVLPMRCRSFQIRKARHFVVSTLDLARCRSFRRKAGHLKLSPRFDHHKMSFRDILGALYQQALPAS